jgi:DNA-binding NtrC family response regulator
MIYLPQHSAFGTEVNQVTEMTRKGNENILFVDDEKEITYMGKKMLESLGYTVDIRTDGFSALHEIQTNKQKYDLLVTDQNMPKMLGTDLVLRAKKIRPDLKVILITGYEDSVKEGSISEYDIAEIVMKPLILSEFSKTIRNVLDTKATQTA